MNLKLPKRGLGCQSLSQNLEVLMEFFKNNKASNTIKEQLIRFVIKVLNEENRISSHLQNAMLYGRTDGIEQKTKQPIPDLDEDRKAQVIKILKRYTLAQQVFACNFQVGPGNNHVLIKNILKVRWWCQKISKSSNKLQVPQLLWTQWRKPKYYETMQKYDQLKKEIGWVVDDFQASRGKLIQAYLREIVP